MLQILNQFRWIIYNGFNKLVPFLIPVTKIVKISITPWMVLKNLARILDLLESTELQQRLILINLK